jgi:hypothetical protein
MTDTNGVALFGISLDVGDDVAEANASLIGAAPDLLAAARIAETAISIADTACHDSFKDVGRCGECIGCALAAALAVIRQAIAKAERTE